MAKKIREWLHNLRIGTKIILWMSVALGIAMLISSLVLYDSIKDAHYRESAIALSMLADGHAQSVEGWITSMEGDVKVVTRGLEADDPEVADTLIGHRAVGEDVNQRMERVAEAILSSRTIYDQPAYIGVAFVRPDGTALASFPTDQPFHIPGSFVGFLRRGVTICKPYYDTKLQSYALFVGGPLHTSDGSYAGALVLRINLAFLDKMVSARRGIGESRADIYLVNWDGTILTQSQMYKSIATRGMNASKYAGPAGALSTHGSGWKVYPSYHGEKVIGSWTWIPETNWAVLAEMQTKEVTKEVRGFLWIPIAVLVLIAVFAMISMYRVIRMIITAPVERLANVTARLADGDLTQEVRVDRSDEIGVLERSLNEMIESLRAAIVSLRHVAEEEMQTSSALAEASQQQAASVTEGSTSVAEVSTTMTELSHSAERIADQTKSITEQVKESGHLSEVGNRAVQRSVSGIQVLQEKVQRLAKRIEILESNSGKIAGIVDVIRKIADETHILALNAAIESAAAGEYGRRFAVVAEEVKRLSEETMNAASGINTMIGDMQAATRSAVLATEELSKEAEQDVVLIQQAGISINGIVKRMNEVEGLSESISQATEQQQVASEQITEAFKGISDMMRENVENSSRLAELSEKLLKRSKEWLNSFKRFALPKDVTALTDDTSATDKKG